MNGRRDEDRFINQLLEETYQVLPCEGDDSAPDYKHFEERENITGSSWYFQYREETRCYRLTISDIVLDFPENWSLFAEDKNSQIIIDRNNNPDQLLEVFQFVDQSIERVVLKKDKNSLIAIVSDLEAAQAA